MDNSKTEAEDWVDVPLNSSNGSPDQINDWVDVPLEEETADDWIDIPLEKASKTSSFIRGAAQGLTMGAADEITGFVESLFTDKTYEQARDESRAAYDKAERDNPAISLAGDAAGILASAILSGGAGAAANVAARGAASAITKAAASKAGKNMVKALLKSKAVRAGTAVASGGKSEVARFAIKEVMKSKAAKSIVEAAKSPKAAEVAGRAITGAGAATGSVLLNIPGRQD